MSFSKLSCHFTPLHIPFRYFAFLRSRQAKLHFIYFARSRSVVTRCLFLPPNPNKVEVIFIGGKTQLVYFRSPAGHCGHFCVTVFDSPELVSGSLPLFAYSLLVMSQPILQTLGKSCSFNQLH